MEILDKKFNDLNKLGEGNELFFDCVISINRGKGI